jgi:DNA-binding protein YbaB
MKGGFDIQGMMKQMGDMQKKLQDQMQKLNEEKEIKEYRGSAGDDGIEVSILIDGNFNIKSIILGEELKNLIASDSQIYLTVLIDLLIAAYSKAKCQIDEDSGGADLSDLENLIPGDMKNMLGNLGNLLK